MVYNLFENAPVVADSLVVDGALVFAMGVYPKKRLPATIFVENLGMVETGHYIQRVEQRKGFWAWYLYSRHFEAPRRPGDPLYTLKPPGREVLADVLRRSPVPMREEWLEEALEAVETEEVSTRNGFVRIWKSRFPSPETLGRYASYGCRKECWVAHHGRLPQSKLVRRAVFAPERFRLKPWRNFLNRIGGMEALEALSPEDAEAAIHFYEVLGPDFADYFRWGVSWHQTDPSNWIGRARKGEIDLGLYAETLNRAMRLIGQNFDTDEERHRYLFSAVSHLATLVEKRERWSKWRDLKRIFSEIAYPRVRVEEVAEVCAAAKIPESGFLKAEDLWLRVRDAIERAPVTIPTLSGETEDLRWRMIDVRDPRWMTVGYETHCCQHLESIGGACVEFVAGNPDRSTCFLVTDRKGNAVAQSFCWLDDSRTALVFDNIEALGELRNKVVQAYVDYVKAAAPRLRTFGVHRATVGSRYSDVDLSVHFKKASPIAPPPATLAYTDAGEEQYLIADF